MEYLRNRLYMLIVLFIFAVVSLIIKKAIEKNSSELQKRKALLDIEAAIGSCIAVISFFVLPASTLNESYLNVLIIVFSAMGAYKAYSEGKVLDKEIKEETKKNVDS